MVKVLLNLSDDANKKLREYMFITGITSKTSALEQVVMQLDLKKVKKVK